MTMRYLSFLLLLAISCKTGVIPKKQISETPISVSEIQSHLSFLASDKLEGRAIGTRGIEKAAKYIESQFEKAEIASYYKTYRDSFPYLDTYSYNIIAFKEGIDPQLKKEYVLISAHYDHLGIQKPVKGDSIANGANDDASGVAAVLTLANYLSKKETKRSVLFVLFSGEEKGLLGSSHLADRMKKEGVKPAVMLNLEMIGVPQSQSDYKAYLTGYNISNLGDRLNGYIGKNTLGYFAGEQQMQLFKRSDNYPFYRQFSIPAHTLSTYIGMNYPQYHRVDDELDRLDIEFMTGLLRELLPGIEGILNAENAVIQLRYN